MLAEVPIVSHLEIGTANPPIRVVSRVVTVVRIGKAMEEHLTTVVSVDTMPSSWHPLSVNSYPTLLVEEENCHVFEVVVWIIHPTNLDQNVHELAQLEEVRIMVRCSMVSRVDVLEADCQMPCKVVVMSTKIVNQTMATKVKVVVEIIMD